MQFQKPIFISNGVVFIRILVESTAACNLLVVAVVCNLVVCMLNFFPRF